MTDQGSSDCMGSCPTPPQLQLYQTIIFATPVLFAFLLLLLFCMLYLRRRRGASIHSQIRSPFLARGLLATAPIDHGLSKSFRQRLPTVPFDEKFAATHEDTQCAVCLGEYLLNEKLQQLPVCKHSFHVQCIDEWLAKNTTCPICRTSLLQGGNVDSVNSSQPQDASGIESSLRGEESRRWEERVVSEIQDQGPHMRADVSGGASSSGIIPSEAAARLSGEHSINIERS